MQIHNRLVAVFTLMVKAGAIFYACVVTLVIVSNFSVFHPNWPLALFASFSETLIVALPVVIVMLLLSWRQALLPTTILAICAFYPFFTFNKFVKPSGDDCNSIECVSVVAANIRNNADALVSLTHTEDKNADILIITELPYGATSEDLLAMFPMHGEAQVALLTKPHLQLGSRLAVLSRKPLDGIELQLVKFPTPKVLQRGIVKFNYVTASGGQLTFVVLHSPPPKGRAAMASRDAYLGAASEFLMNKQNFIMIGDFNMTPWESGFAALPGKRAGDPRWVRTWNARKFWQRITIDHALIGEGVGVIETSVLPDIGSDHFPIRVVIHSTGG